MRRPRQAAAAAALALAAAVAGAAPACAGGSQARGAGDGAPEPGCVERRLAEGTAYRYDPGTVLAFSHGVAAAHPHLAGLVEAVAEHERRAPRPERLDPAGPRDAPADTSLVYALALADLAARPDLATPDAVALLTDAAAGAGVAGGDRSAGADARPTGGPGGMAGVVRLLTSDRRVVDAGDPALAELSALVWEQQRAVAGAGMVDARHAGCEPDPRP